MARKSSLAATVTRPVDRDQPATMNELIQSIQQSTSVSSMETPRLPIDRLVRGRYQPRQIHDEADPELLELADSIRALGLIEPIAVRPLPEATGQFEILAGDRRWRAARLAGLTEAPVIVHAVDDRMAAAMSLIENLQRQDLNPLEAAVAMQRLREEFQLSQDHLGQMLGLSKSVISRTLGLLSLVDEVQLMLRSNQLDAGHARVLIGLNPVAQIELAQQTVARGWSVRELEKRKSALVASQSKPGKLLDASDFDLRRLETLLGEWLAAPVEVSSRKGGRGSITIRFASAEECTGILQKIGLDLSEF
jgi:ParB family chromosome partitioning protein